MISMQRSRAYTEIDLGGGGAKFALVKFRRLIISANKNRLYLFIF